jgi:hypothetical protein
MASTYSPLGAEQSSSALTAPVTGLLDGATLTAATPAFCTPYMGSCCSRTGGLCVVLVGTLGKRQLQIQLGDVAKPASSGQTVTCRLFRHGNARII